MKIEALRILTDENISPRIVYFLRQKGIDVLDVKEKGWHGSPDKNLLNIAFGEKRFILTHDSDFGMLSINEGNPCYGIIYLRLRNLKADHVNRVLEKFLSIDKEISPGLLFVLEDGRVRIREIAT
ncbi:MAG: DUF5615 family PIN-like protein [bacterium]